MNRTKGMAAAIILILCLGTGITAYTKKITKSQEGETVSAVWETTAASLDETVTALPAETDYGENTPKAAKASAATAGVVEGISKNKQKDVTEKEKEAAAAISPIEISPSEMYAAAGGQQSDGKSSNDQESFGDSTSSPNTGKFSSDSDENNGSGEAAAGRLSVLRETEADSKSSSSLLGNSSENSSSEDSAAQEVPYEKRLKELEAQAGRLRTSDGASNQYIIQNAAEKEWKLWDGELNRIYNIILDSLTREEAEKLVKEEREWIISRDHAASAASRDSGGSMESVEYRMALAAATRTRVYELGEKYGQFLTEEE